MVRFFLIALCVCCLSGVTASASAPTLPQSASVDYEEVQKTWEKSLSKIADAFSEEEAPAQLQLDERKERLRAVRDEALVLSEPLKAELAAQQQLLGALGVAPPDPTIEAPEIRKQRQALNDEVAAVDARLKNVKLVIARAEELLSTIDTLEKNRVRTELFARNTILWSPTIMQQFSVDAMDYAAHFHGWFSALMIVGCVIASLLLAPRLNLYLNRLCASVASIELLTPFRKSPLLSVIMAACLTLLLRLDIIILTSHPVLEAGVQAIAGLTLSILLFMLLAKIRFISPLTRTDALGEHRKDYHWMWNSAKRLIMLVLMTIPMMIIAGYLNLGLYLAFNMVVTTFSCLLFVWLRAQAVAINQRFQPVKEENEEGVVEVNKPKGTAQLSPLAITVLEPILALVSIALAAFFWGTTADDVAGWGDHVRHGFVIGEITIDVASIGEAILLFFVLSFVSKMLQWFLSSRVFPYTSWDMGLQEATLTITGYVGVIIAVLASMSAIGLNMSNFAIVAGALSVGIGFGLQAIFNNFVSGLILLFERPFKVGDWIVVGVHQGLIKKIRVRSTEIETFQNASIIVPNSQLISDVVTNWTLHDEVGRVDISVNVAYGADTDKVRQLLLKVGKDHPQVRTYPPSRVFLMEFAETHLRFELRCFIRNINDATPVSSDLRFAIDKVLRENNISMPIPKQEIFMRSSEELSTPTL
jgi:small-conductance mechanosensitive channel